MEKCMSVVRSPAQRRVVRFPVVLVVFVVAVVLVAGSGGAAGQTLNNPIPAELASGRTERLAHELKARHERQIRAGLLEEAAQTAQQLEELTRTQIEKCGGWWNDFDTLKRGGMPKKLPNQKTIMKMATECQWRPGQPPAHPQDDDKKSPRVEGFWRAPLFVEPTLLTWTVDPGVMDVLLIDFGKAKQRSPELERLDLEANMAFFRADSAAADKIVDEMLSLLQRSPDTKPGAIAAVLDKRRAAEEFLGNIPAALEHARAEIEFLEGKLGTASVGLCPALWHTASLLVSSKQPERAVAAANRCVSIAASRDPSSQTYASALNNLGVIEHQNGAVDRALDAYEKSLVAFERSPPTTQSRATQPMLSVHANLGLAYWQHGDVANAYRHLQLARQQMSREGRNDISEKGAVNTLTMLSRELDFFLTVERAPLPVAPDGSTLALPMLLERKGFGLGAKAATVKALAAEPEQLREYRTLLAYRSALARARSPIPEEQATHQKIVDEVDLQIQTLEFDATARSTTAAAISERLSTSRNGDYEKYAKARLDAVDKRSRDYFKHRPKNDHRTEQEVLNEIDRQVEAEMAPLFKDVLDAVQQPARGNRETLLHDIQSKLPDTEALIEMVRFRPFKASAVTEAERWEPAHYGAYVIRRTGTPTFLDYGAAAAIDDLVIEFRRTLSLPRGTLAHDLGRRLDAALMQPIRTQLGTATQIHMSPDGLLNLVPFGALVDEQDRYLIETLTFNYVSSGRDLLREPTSANARSAPAVLIADPTFDGGLGDRASSSTLRSMLDNHFDPLPGTAVEAQAIKTLLPDAVVFTRERATETALKSVAAPRILHIATHGFFLADQDLSGADSATAAGLEDPMLRSGLVFAGANEGRSGADDGVLTALEASALGLAGTELVVLSACETGVGDVKTGEGVFGLRRAFMAAGAETLVMSLWRVDDDATRQLMVEFYRRLVNGEGRAEALRQASLTLLRDPTHRHPFYWASFIMTGEGGRMRH
jgi:CHAT domain-containing protein